MLRPTGHKCDVTNKFWSLMLLLLQMLFMLIFPLYCSSTVAYGFSRALASRCVPEFNLSGTDRVYFPRIIPL